mgnify:CR=1 FL=1
MAATSNDDKPKQTTKQCPNCGDTHLGEIRSQFIKICANNKCPVTEIPWELSDDQKMIT